MRSTIVAAASAALLLSLAACGPSREEEAEQRRAAAESAATERLSGDLDRAVADVVRAKDGKGRIPLADAVDALEAKGYTAGASPMERAEEDASWCVWLADERTERSFVHQSVEGRAAEVDGTASGCDPVVYPAEEVAAPTFGESPADRERELAQERTDTFLEENAAAIAAEVDRVWIVGPVGEDARTPAQKKVEKRKTDALLDALNDYDVTGDQPGAGFNYGVGIDDEHFCVYAAVKAKDGSAFVYQSLTDDLVRVEPGTATCTAANTER